MLRWKRWKVTEKGEWRYTDQNDPMCSRKVNQEKQRNDFVPEHHVIKGFYFLISVLAVMNTLTIFLFVCKCLVIRSKSIHNYFKNDFGILNNALKILTKMEKY